MTRVGHGIRRRFCRRRRPHAVAIGIALRSHAGAPGDRMGPPPTGRFGTGVRLIPAPAGPRTAASRHTPPEVSSRDPCRQGWVLRRRTWWRQSAPCPVPVQPSVPSPAVCRKSHGIQVSLACSGHCKCPRTPIFLIRDAFQVHQAYRSSRLELPCSSPALYDVYMNISVCSLFFVQNAVFWARTSLLYLL